MGTVHAKAENTNLGIPAAHINYDECEEGKVIPLDVPARVDRIHIDGIGRTKNDIVETSVRDIFTATTFEEVLLKTHIARQRLESLYCFRNISIYVDTSKGPKSTENGLEVTFSVKELRRVVGGVTTQVGNNEGALIVGLRAPNIFGRGERVQVEYSYGSAKSDNFNIAFIKPFVGRHNPIFSTSVYQMHTETPTSGYKELNRGILFDFGFNSLPLLKHNLQWDVAFRDLAVLSRGSSFEVREQAGSSMKSSLKHVLSVDLRDERIFPTCGSLFQMTSELAGIGGDVGFWKNDFYIQSNYPILEDIIFQATFAGGIMRGISNDMKIGLSDMFYIGGPLSVRGFQSRGIGPRSDNDSLGSTCFWSGGLHLFTHLPFRPGKGGIGDMFRTHFFVNAGNVGNFDDSEDKTILEQLSDNIRMSYGVGIAMRLGQMARFEINYCFPHQYDKTDRTQPGVQFGIGMQFL